MIRSLTLFCFLLSCGSGLFLYSAKHRTAVLDQTITQTVKDTRLILDRTAMLKTRWALLNQPDRLRTLANNFTPQLQITSPHQYTKMASLHIRLPPVMDVASQGLNPATGPLNDKIAKSLPQHGGNNTANIPHKTEDVAKNNNRDAKVVLASYLASYKVKNANNIGKSNLKLSSRRHTDDKSTKTGEIAATRKNGVVLLPISIQKQTAHGKIPNETAQPSGRLNLRQSRVSAGSALDYSRKSLPPPAPVLPN